MLEVVKPVTDWTAIEAGYRGSEKISHMAARHGVTRQAIQQRAKRHHWPRSVAACGRAPGIILEARMTGSPDLKRLVPLIAGGMELRIILWPCPAPPAATVEAAA